MSELNGPGRVGVFYRASKTTHYEISDHLGNVRVVIDDHIDITTGNAIEISHSDYYAHGWEMPGRQLISSQTYKFAYQGIEKDGATGWAMFELRSMDTRLGRWSAPDPYGQHYSPYLAMGNNPVSAIDPDGGFDGVGGGLDVSGFPAQGMAQGPPWWTLFDFSSPLVYYTENHGVAGGGMGTVGNSSGASGYIGRGIENRPSDGNPPKIEYKKLDGRYKEVHSILSETKAYQSIITEINLRGKDANNVIIYSVTVSAIEYSSSVFKSPNDFGVTAFSSKHSNKITSSGLTLALTHRAVVSFNKTKLKDATDLKKAHTEIHELIHILIKRKKTSFTENPDYKPEKPPGEGNEELLLDTDPDSKDGHTVMADEYTDEMIKALTEFAEKANMLTTENKDEVEQAIKYLAWSGVDYNAASFKAFLRKEGITLNKFMNKLDSYQYNNPKLNIQKKK